MDCCNKYSQYKHYSGLGGVSGLMADNPENYYSHMHPSSFRYQTSLYRFNSSTGSSCNGIGPPTTISISPTTNLYQNYDRYNTYSNLSPYAYNSNTFNSYNNINSRSMNEYYNHCDNFNRIGIGSSNFLYHHNYRNPYDINIHNGTRGGSSTNNYNLYSHHSNLSDRDYHYYHEYQHSGYFSSNNLHYNHNYQSHFHQNHHHHHYHHHTPPPAPPPSPPTNPHSHLYHSSHHFHLRNTASKDSLTSRTYLETHNKMKIAPNERDECKNVNNPNITTSSTSPISLSPVSTYSHSQLNCNDSCTSDTINNRSGTNDNYSNNKETLHEEQRQKDQPEQDQNQTTSNGTRNDSIEFSTNELKESKSRKSTTKDKDKSFSRQLAGTNRRVECSTSLNQSPILKRPGTPFISSSYSNNLSRTHKGFSSFNQTNSINNNNGINNCWSPFNAYELTNSPNDWSHHHHRYNNNNSKLSKKRCNTRKSSPSSSSISSFITNKNRILECDFIPSKKSKKKIKSESSSDDFYEYREEIKNITPLPGFQQAFGSTEIGRFSETFFSAIDSPIEPLYESEADTLSPQPWETGDSLDGPHYNLYIGASVQPMYSSENYTSTSSNDSPIDSNYFGEIQCSDY